MPLSDLLVEHIPHHGAHYRAVWIAIFGYVAAAIGL